MHFVVWGSSEPQEKVDWDCNFGLKRWSVLVPCSLPPSSSLVVSLCRTSNIAEGSGDLCCFNLRLNDPFPLF